MSKNLLIVESPAKAKTIEKYLGKDYSVLSSFGHIRDLPKKGMSVDLKNNFEPTYAVSSDKKKTVAALRKAAKQAEMIWLASDEDREGEAIAWHLYEALKLTPKNTRRITFNEITKPAVSKAIENPREIDQDLVDAQQARRVLDRIVGYELSPLLWRKVQAGLSAGRVQSVAVRLVVERERELQAFESESTYGVSGEFRVDNSTLLPAKLKSDLKDEAAARTFVKHAEKATFNVKDIQTKDGTRNPGPPFTTSTLQQTASSVLGMSPKQTMMLAQRLYESGHITYMRTDSLNLSDQALGQAKDVIIKKFGADHYKRRVFKSKSKGAQEAHEAIRPTNLAKDVAGNDERQKKLYQLIRSRTLSSQMSPAKLERKTLTVAISEREEVFEAKGEVVTFAGFLAMALRAKDDVILPEVKIGQELAAESILAVEKLSRGPTRFTEASLIKKLEELGIGRPSTFAPTIGTIQDRNYVEKADVEGEIRKSTNFVLNKGDYKEEEAELKVGNDSNKLIPTSVALIVTDFLVKHFQEVTDYDFTAKLEQEFDDIATGDKKWRQVLSDFYKPFHKDVEEAMNVSRQEASQARELGNDPKSGKPVIARLGRFGPMVQIGSAEDEEKPQFASIPESHTLETVTLDIALKMFELPRTVGKTTEGEEIIANRGRFGPYVKFGKIYVNIKGEDPFTITEETALKLIAAHKDKLAKQHIKSFNGGIDIKDGRYGPYVTDGKTNAKIPKDVEPSELTLEEAKKLLEERAKKPTRKRKTKRKKK